MTTAPRAEQTTRQQGLGRQWERAAEGQELPQLVLELLENLGLDPKWFLHHWQVQEWLYQWSWISHRALNGESCDKGAVGGHEAAQTRL